MADPGVTSLAIVERERLVLGQIAGGMPLGQVLDGLMRAVEAGNDHGMMASVLILDEDGGHLRHGAAPSLPAAYNAAIDGIAVGEGVGSCGTVASRGTPVYATDIATDPLWRDFRALALSHDLRACWSTPIRDADGGMLGTFAIYYDAPRSPTEADIEAIAFVTQTAALAIERHRHDLRLRQSQERLHVLNAELEAVNRTLRERLVSERDTQDRLAKASDVARLGTYAWNATTGHVGLNARGRAMLGLPPEGDVRQEDVFARIDPDEFEDVLAAARAGLEAGERVEIDYTVVLPDGTRRVVRSLGDVATNALGERLMDGVLHDITAETHAERALRTANVTLGQQVQERTSELRFYRDIVQASAAPICAFDTDYRLTAFNRAHGDEFYRIFAHRVQVGEVFPDLFPPDQAPVMRNFMDRALAGESYTVTEAFGDPGLAKPCWEVTYSPLRDEGGRVVGAFHYARDVSARLRTEAELALAQEALRQSQKMEAVGQLTGGLAHDFNNLLAGISGSLELMQTRMQQGRLTDVDRYMTAAQGAAKRAAALTHRLLAFSRRQTLDPKPTDVNRLATGMQELIQRTVGPAIQVEVVGATNAWPALVDPPQLENALLNLCINARDAMPDGGRIVVETANKWMDERAARQHDMPEGQYLSVAVTDTGTGMPPEVVARVFEPFFTTKPIGEGTGLGLSMIYGFAQQSGGQVRIYSEVGQGTTVCIYLPRHYGKVAGDDVAVEALELPRSEQGETVLVVDDEPTVRMLVTDILEDLGYAAIEAGDSATGLKVLQSDVRIDLLVTDVGLPGGMNRRQMADAARNRRPNLKVLFITGYAENAVLGNGTLPPGMAVLTKPFAMDNMAARIRSMIEGAKEQARRA